MCSTKKKICTPAPKPAEQLPHSCDSSRYYGEEGGVEEYYLADFDKFAASNAVSAENELEKSRGREELLQN